MLKTSFSAIQWVAFMIASSVVAPIAIADIFHLQPVETTLFVQRTIFVLGISSILQGLFGHRQPINEGPAGLWWSVFAIYAGFIGTIYSSGDEALRTLEGGMLVSAVVFIILAVFGLIEKLKNLFTPTATFVYLILLILQLSGSFIKGMLGLSNEHPHVQPMVLLGSTVIVILTFFLGSVKIKWINQYSILSGLAIGWLLFIILGLAPPVSKASHPIMAMPEIFPFGFPKMDSGMFATAAFTALLLTTNMIASVRVMEEAQQKLTGKLPTPDYKRAGIVSGVNQAAGGLFGAVGPVPISGAAGFVSATNMPSIKPFIFGSILITILSLFPKVMDIMASIPAPAGYAVTFVIFSRMVGMAFSEFEKETDKPLAKLTAGVSLMIGVGAMFIPPEATKGLPIIFASLLNNGLILGTLAAILTEQFIRIKQRNT
ncbi:purine/pyrimidine permease [Falsibacillus pallidus]|uniref:purine/pyrimidine permease n=1 Tax=Falsibacillus pallidus TaxID=493781 RepID=UPI003D98F7C3